MSPFQRAQIKQSPAFTRLELLVVVSLLLVWASLLVLKHLLIPACLRARAKAQETRCLANLKDLGAAARLWANEHHSQFPWQVPASEGGTRDLFASENRIVPSWANYAILLGASKASPKTLICPSDERQPTCSLASLTNNLNLSYFTAISASSDSPHPILAGDRNVGRFGGESDGFSPDNGQGDVVVDWFSVSWKLDLHSKLRRVSAENTPLGKPGFQTDAELAATGNILFRDGSAQLSTTSDLNYQCERRYYDRHFYFVRLIFP